MLRAMLKHMPRSNATYVRTYERTDMHSPSALTVAFGDNARAYSRFGAMGENGVAARPPRGDER